MLPLVELMQGKRWQDRHSAATLPLNSLCFPPPRVPRHPPPRVILPSSVCLVPAAPLVQGLGFVSGSSSVSACGTPPGPLPCWWWSQRVPARTSRTGFPSGRFSVLLSSCQFCQNVIYGCKDNDLFGISKKRLYYIDVSLNYSLFFGTRRVRRSSGPFLFGIVKKCLYYTNAGWSC